MKKHGMIFLGILLLMGGFGCRKTYTNPTVPYVFNSSPEINEGLELNNTFFQSLPDNSFIISCKAPSYAYLDKEVFLHYDAHFNFIDSTYYSEDLFFGSGAESDASIYNVFLQANHQRTKWKYTLLKTDYQYKKLEQSWNLLDSMLGTPYQYPQIVQLQNGTLVTALTTANGSSINGVQLMAFNKNIQQAPLWKKNSIYQVNLVKGNVLSNMASDGNFFYVLCLDNSSFKGVLVKHDEHGNLVWKKEMPDYFGKNILVQKDKILLFGQGSGINSYDKEGNELGSNKIKDVNLVDDGKGGFVAVNVLRGFSTEPDYSIKITQYNSFSEPIKSRIFGDGNYHNFAFGKLADGSYVLVLSMRVNQLGQQLIFYRLNQDLDNYYQ